VIDQEMEAPIDDLQALDAVEDEELLGDAGPACVGARWGR
jgi:hypothetical protein